MAGLTPKQAFHFGFLARCAEEGLDPAATQVRIKQAHALYDLCREKAAGVAGLLWKMPLAGLGLAGLTGATTGYLQHQLTKDDLPSPEELKKRELAAALRRHTELAKRETERRQKRREARRAPPPPRLV